MLWHDFVDISEAELQAGKIAWSAITAATPVALTDFVNTRTTVLPIMGHALKRHLQELPWTSNGLGLSEHTTLRILQEKGTMSAAHLFGWFQNHYDPLPGMGDAFYYKWVHGLAEAEEPAIHLNRRGDKPNEWDLELTSFGNKLLAGEADWLAANPVQRWVGGVFIDSRAISHWRWNDNRDNVVEIKR